jgi:acetoin utilization protein AcuB
MQEHRIGALPVMDRGKLVGIITTTDVTKVLLDAIGINGDSTRFVVLIKDRVGMIAEVSRILKEAAINIRSFVTWPEQKHPGVYHFVIRVGAADGEKAIAALTGAGFKVLTEYIDDLGPYLPA